MDRGPATGEPKTMSREKDLAAAITTPVPGTWVQTERNALKAISHLAATNPKAVSVLTAIMANMQRHNALVASYATLAKVSNCSPRTVRRAIAALKEGNWIQVRQIGEAGTVNAYIVNDRVAWTGQRDGIRYSLFSADILVTDAEQPSTLDETSPLLKLPRIMKTPPQQIDMEAYINDLDKKDALE